MKTKQKTVDAVAILRSRYVGNDAARETAIAQQHVHANVARQIYDLRTRAGMTQKELAERIGTTQSVISRLEDADYEGHSIGMLQRIADVLAVRVNVELKPEDPTVKPFVFRTFLHLLRRSRKLTLDELSRQTDIDREELAALEQQEGYRPSPRTVHRLSLFYGLVPAKLAALAGAIDQPVDEVQEPAFRFAAMSESFSELSREEKRALKELVEALRERRPG